MQTAFHQQLIQKIATTKSSCIRSKNQFYQDHQLIFCEHHHVYTLGKSGSMDHLLAF
jgi:lipoate-protein ligase B